MTHMTTAINGQPADWTPDIWQLWYTYVERADPKLYDSHGLPSAANYFTPRPYVDAYNRGDEKAGFTVTIGQGVHQVITNGKGIPWLVQEPRR
jgi:hypothetical protein